MSSVCGQSSASLVLAKQCSSSGPQPVLPDGQQHEDITWWPAMGPLQKGRVTRSSMFSASCGLGTAAGVVLAPNYARYSMCSLNLLLHLVSDGY